jgi:hypothetical protein
MRLFFQGALLAFGIFSLIASPAFANNDCCVWEPDCGALCNSTWTASGDFLYWRALQNGLSSGWGPDIKDRWNPSYRLGLEYDSADRLSAASYWTSYNSRSTRSKKKHEADDHVHWKLDYETIDGQLKYDFYTNSCSTYSPFVGVRGAWIDEKLNAHFDDNDGCDDKGLGSISNLIITEQHHKEKFWGVGPYIGIGADWNLGSGFSIFGSIDVGILYGNFKITVDDIQTMGSEADPGTFCNRRHVRACQAFVDAAVGIQWERCLTDSMALILRLGAEHHRYFNHNQIGGYGDLCLDGGVFSAGLRF